jgi:serine/threonine protein kinase/tetratricopeptide (TPR) repeat protein
MSPEPALGPRRRLGRLFERALDLPHEERPGFVEAARREDPELGAELESLLASHAAAPDYLEALAGKVLPGALGAFPPDTLAPGRKVGRYEIVEPIATGGMGVVYKAHDVALDRLAALKFLPSGQSRNPRARARLTGEARAASALDHPNIAVVYEIGVMDPAPAEDEDPRPFIAMPYYSGETLAEKAKQGPLPVSDVLDWARQIAEGLSRAHEAGIVHRDIKAANLLVTDRGQVKILDFGVAKVAGVDLMSAGVRMGTVAYMSPEQTRGGAVDHRTDLWSLGVVLYELFGSVRPFDADTDDATLHRIRHDEPAALETLRPEIPTEVAAMVHRCLAKEPGARPASARSLRAELRSIEASGSGTVPADIEDRTGIVVLPFVNLSPDPHNAYFSDGLTEEVIVRLSHIRALRVISRTSAMRLKDSPKDVPAISRQLGIRYVLEGSVRKSGDELRIAARLIDAASDEHLWTETYEGTVAEVLRIQERVGNAIAGALRIELSPAEARALGRRGIEDPMALKSYLRARHETWTFSEPGLQRARRHVLNALRIVGDNELLLATLGQIHVWFLQAGVAPDPRHLDEADRCAEAIFRISSHSSYGSKLRGFVEFQRGNLRGALPHLQATLERHPDDPDALITVGYLYCLAGREGTGAAYFQRLLAIDPLTPLNHAMSGFVAVLQGRFADAVAPYGTFLQMEDDGPFSMGNWVWVLGLNGRIGEAESVVRRMRVKHPDTPFTSIATSLFHGLQGDRSLALDAISATLREAGRHSEMFARFLAQCYAVAGEVGEALSWLERAVELGLAHHSFLSRIDPLLEPIRSTPSFQRLMETVEEEWRAFPYDSPEILRGELPK